MDIRRFYVVSPRGECGPFSIEELAEELRSGHVTGQQQVRTGMGTMIGTVREVLDAPDPMWNPMDSTAAGLSAVVVAQRRNRNLSLVILGMTLIPATALYFFLSPGQVAAPPRTSSERIPASMAPPAPAATTVRSENTVRPPADAPSSSPTAAAPAAVKPTTAAISTTPAMSSDLVRLTALTAIVTVPGARLQGRDTPIPHIGTWNSQEGGVEWKTRLAPGRYAVTLTYACNKSGAGAMIVVSAGRARCSEPTRDHASWDNYQPHTFADPLVITEEGDTTIQVRAGSRKSSAFMKLAEVSLRRLP
jgi:hypothetical protein